MIQQEDFDLALSTIERAVAVLRKEKVEREKVAKKVGPTLDQMALSVDPEAVWTFADDQLHDFRRKAATLLRKLDEWFKARAGGSANNYDDNLRCHLGLPETS